ncbi:MAG: hypothetical protein LBC44_00490 [Mycoplasmataceae bacterium]|jgi:hypothetical protein|nr:hypothetical protein [Mycoplasmataceae bacterium]
MLDANLAVSSFALPGFWQEIANLIGQTQADLVYSYFQYIEIGLIICAVLMGAIVTLGYSIRLWGSDNEDAKKQLKMARSKFFHMTGYIFLGLLFIEIFWMWILPPIWSWASSAN